MYVNGSSKMWSSLGRLGSVLARGLARGGPDQNAPEGSDPMQTQAPDEECTPCEREKRKLLKQARRRFRR